MSKWSVEQNDAFFSLVRLLNVDCTLESSCDTHTYLSSVISPNAALAVTKFSVHLDRVCELMSGARVQTGLASISRSFESATSSMRQLAILVAGTRPAHMSWKEA